MRESPKPQGLHHQTRTATKQCQFWIRISVYILFLIAGQSVATLLGRLYYDKGGNSKWMATLVQSAGFPILIPLIFFFTSSPTTDTATPSKPPPLSTIVGLYIFFGLLLTGDNMMYSYGLLYLPVSTYSLLCATQLAFNAIFSYFINAQKFTILILNSLFVLTISASLLAVHSDMDNTEKIAKGKYIIGFLCTLGASATFSLYLSLIQFSFEKVFKKQTFRKILNMQIYPSFIASCACVVGIFASGEWDKIKVEMRDYQEGKVSYVMTLVWTAVAWQVSSIGMIGLIFEVTSLFSNVISTMALPVVPIFAVIFFHDKMDGVKVIALLLAIWGFVSYIYQHYLDNANAKSKVDETSVDVNPRAPIENC